MMIESPERLDLAMVSRGLAPTRSRAYDLIKRGLVTIDGRLASKPSQTVSTSSTVQIEGQAGQYVSRGSAKLIRALDEFRFSPLNEVCLDLGASTGGFTQILLERGARHVYAVDVGTGQLHSELTNNSRVTNLEKTDVRRLSSQLITEPVGAIVADLSFISLTKVLAIPMHFARPGAWMVVLVKPQFELGPNAVDKKGVVRDEKFQQTSVDRISSFIEQSAAWHVIDAIPSPIRGKGGNKEYLLGACLENLSGSNNKIPRDYYS